MISNKEATLSSKVQPLAQNEAERRYQDFLDAHGYDFFRVDQSLASFARSYQGHLKRPDYIVLLDRYIKIAVDVKDWCLDNKFLNFHIDEKELNKEIAWGESNGIPLWFAISNRYSNYEIWHYIAASRLFSCPKHTSLKSGEPFRTFTIADCIIISPRDSLSRLFK